VDYQLWAEMHEVATKHLMHQGCAIYNHNQNMQEFLKIEMINLLKIVHFFVTYFVFTKLLPIYQSDI